MQTSSIIFAWTRTVLGLVPTLIKARLRGAKSPDLYTLRLGKSAIFSNLVEALANGGVIRVVDVDVGTRTWTSNLYFFVYFSLVAATKRHVHGFLHQQFAFYIVALLFCQIIGARAWVFHESLFCVWRCDFVCPEVDSVGGAHKRAIVWLSAID